MEIQNESLGWNSKLLDDVIHRHARTLLHCLLGRLATTIDRWMVTHYGHKPYPG